MPIKWAMNKIVEHDHDTVFFWGTIGFVTLAIVTISGFAWLVWNAFEQEEKELLVVSRGCTLRRKRRCVVESRYRLSLLRSVQLCVRSRLLSWLRRKPR